MIRRFRFATVLAALLTLFAYAAENTAALVLCEPAGATPAMIDSGDGDAHSDHGGSAPKSNESGPSHQNHCPIGMTGSGSCAVATLPPGLSQVQAAPVTSDHDWVGAMDSFASASVHPLFHPPRA
jgi:hypothetical protein